MKKIAVLIPCYNEEKTIVKVIKDFNKILPEAIIYVYDNNSKDNSYSLAKKEKCIIKKVEQKGKGNVVRKMFQDTNADCYLLVDADDTYSPRLARKMCNIVLNNDADMVIGDRLSTTYYQENKKIIHSFGNKLVCFLVNYLFSYKITDVMSGYRAFSKSFVKNVPILSNEFEVETEMTIYAIENNYIIKSIPVLYKDRPKGSISKIKTVKDGLSIINTIKNLYIEYHPKKYYLFLSLIFILITLWLYIMNNTYYIIFLIISVINYILSILLNSILMKYKRLLEIKRKGGN